MNAKTRRTIRTVLQVLLALAVAVPVIVQATGLTVEQAPWLGTVLIVSGIVARVMQLDAIENVLKPVGLATPPVVEAPTLEGLGGTRQNFTVQVEPGPGGKALDDQLLQMLRKAIRRNGGAL